MQMNQTNQNTGDVINTTEPKIIKPTVGRIVHYYHFVGAPPHAAIIAKVHDDRTVNLTVCNYDGNTFPAIMVRLVQPNEELTAHIPYCCWMDYQVGQAAKTEAVQSELEKAKQEYLRVAQENQKG